MNEGKRQNKKARRKARKIVKLLNEQYRKEGANLRAFYDGQIHIVTPLVWP
jgi:hypothetical protein